MNNLGFYDYFNDVFKLGKYFLKNYKKFLKAIPIF